MELKGLAPFEQAQLIPHRPIMVCYRGSIAHGTHVPPTEPTGVDDVDLLCCYIPPLPHYFGMQSIGGGKDVKIREWDSAAYEFRHFCSLLSNGNPNVLSTLWLKREHYLQLEPEGERLIAARDLFLSKRAYHSFGGYAYSQLKRMTSFKELGPSSCGCSGKFHAPTCAANQEAGRGSKKRFATGFMGEKRKGLVEKFGYDVKNAAHLIRLLRMGVELFQEKTMYVDRTGRDAEELKAIKSGKWLLGEVKEKAEGLFTELKEAAERSDLPENPPEEQIEEMMVEVMSKAFASEVVVISSRAKQRDWKPLEKVLFGMEGK